MNKIFAKLARPFVVKQLAALIVAQANRFPDPAAIVEELIVALRETKVAPPRPPRHVDNEAQ